MVTKKAGHTELKFWGSIDELPMERYIQFQSVVLQDAGIGSTIQDYDKHESSIDAFLISERYEDAIKERENKRFGVYFMLAGINTKSLTLACLCHSIGKNVRYDFSDEGLQETSNLINKTGITYQQVQELVSSLKKNLNQN